MAGISSTGASFRFNGVVSTDKTVMQNLETMCSAAGCWLTYDSNLGRWAVIINQAGASVASFDDSNILGGIQISSTGLMDLYNAVKVSFPHQDLNDQRDFVRYEIPAVDRNPNEPDRDLNIEYDIFNDPVQADLLAIRELKQSRVDQIITFSTDFSSLGLVAGNIIDVSNSMYGFVNKKYRIISIRENDGDDGNIVLDITALEYSDAVYDVSDLYRYERSDRNGIVSIGGLGAPSTPVVAVYEIDSRPRLTATVIVPGLAPVDRMELWFSTDNSTFRLIDTETERGGGTFAVGDSVTFDYDQAPAGTLYVKARAVNATTTGPFSPVASTSYNPVQVPNALNTTTSLLDNGLPISTLLALPKLLAFLDKFMNGNQNAFDQVEKSVYYDLSVSGATCLTKLNQMTAGYTQQNGYNETNRLDRSRWIATSVPLGAVPDILTIDVKTPLLRCSYDFQDRTGTIRSQVLLAQPPLQVGVFFGTTLATATQVAATTIDWNSNYNRIVLKTPAVGTYWIVGIAIPTYDLDMYWSRTGLTPGDYNTIWPINYTDEFGNFDVVMNAITLG